MIHIMQESTRTDRKRELIMTSSEAKRFLCALNPKTSGYEKYSVISADDNAELQEFLEYFSNGFLVPTNIEVLGVVYVANTAVDRRSRIEDNRISINSLLKFQEKIEQAIPGSEIKMVFNTDDFIIFIRHITGDIKLQCKYDLTIVSGQAKSDNGTYVDIEKNDCIIRIVNKLFTKQRYYYKNKRKHGKN